MKRIAAIAAVLCLGILVSGAALADHNDQTPQGLLVTVTDITDFTVTVDVTMTDYTTEGEGITPATMWLGTKFIAEYYPPTYPGIGTFLNPKIPGIDWGDGSTVPATQIPLTNAATGQYHAQYMHTYGAPGDYTIRVFAGNAFNTSGPATITGNTVYAASRTDSVSFVSVRGDRTTRTFGPGDIGISNTATVSSGVFPNPILEVPTTSGTGLAVLGLLLAGAGATLLLVRRS